jgi:ketol-acid reductoisomerase
MKALLGECQSGNYIGAMRAKTRITKESIAVIGYGSQGRSIALNLRDSGYDVLLALPNRSKSIALARKDGIKKIGTVYEIVKECHTVAFAFPDHLHGRVYEKEIKKNLRKGSTLLFLHGLSVHFGYVKPPVTSDVILIAPHAPGVAVREKFLTEKSLSAFYGVYQNFSKKAESKAVVLAGALGFKKQNLVKTTFEQESLGDLFGEQAVLCGGLAALIKNGFEVLIENGVPPRNAYLEVAFQLDQIIALIKKFGISGMLERISVAAQLGSLETGPYLIDKSVKKKMKTRYKQISSGNFSDKLVKLSESEIRKLKTRLKKLTRPDFEKSARYFSK